MNWRLLEGWTGLFVREAWRNDVQRTGCTARLRPWSDDVGAGWMDIGWARARYYWTNAGANKPFVKGFVIALIK